jgi:ATP-dependent Clp protease ATP-binding subunit ClpC
MSHPLEFLSCSVCNNRGTVNGLACPQCRGLGLVAWDGTTLLYWGALLTRPELRRQQTLKRLRMAEGGVALLFGFIGICALAWWLLQRPFTLDVLADIFLTTDPLLWVFWVSVVADAFALYRLHYDPTRPVAIKPKKDQATTPTFRAPLSWATALALPAHQHYDVSTGLSLETRKTIIESWRLADKYGHAQVNPIHVFLGLLFSTQAQNMMFRLGLSFDRVKEKIGPIIAGEVAQNTTTNQPMLSTRVLEIIFESYGKTVQYRVPQIEVTEIFEALAEQPNEVATALFDLGVDTQMVNNMTAWLRLRAAQRRALSQFRRSAGLRPTSTMDRAMTAIATPVLNAFGRDLTLAAQRGYLSTCVERVAELDQICSLLSSGQSRAVILIGQPGVGRTTLLHGLAQRMVEENVPAALRDKRLVSLDVAKIMSGVGSSEAQQRLLLALQEIRRSGNIILAIPDIHLMVASQSGIDVSGVLAQQIRAGGLHVVATTTPREYRRTIEGTSALDAVATPLPIAEVDGDAAIRILAAKVGGIEYEQKVFFSYQAIAQAVQLSRRYVPDQPLPEKAIGLLSETAATVHAQRGEQQLVTGEDVVALISAKTNVPMGAISGQESDVLLHLEDKIHERMVDQNEAVAAVAASLRRARAELRQAQRPIATFLFLGPTGVGKTELAKTLAAVYYGAENKMIRLDMSEYQDHASIQRLLGVAPGPNGIGEGGYLTEAVRKAPFSLILLDEIEKAQPDVLNIFLQVLDDGRLTDATGRTVDFTNTIIIATSNAATQTVQSLAAAGKTAEEIRTILLNEELMTYFRPEFLNRFDGIIVFKPLGMPEVEQITRLLLRTIASDLEARGMSFVVTDEAVQMLAQLGYDPQFGARSLRRVIQSKVQDQLATLIIGNQLQRRDVIELAADGSIQVHHPEQ